MFALPVGLFAILGRVHFKNGARGTGHGTAASAGSKHDLLELLGDRIGERATIVYGQLPVENWHAFIDNQTITEAIPDRLISAAHRIERSGPSRDEKPSDSVVGPCERVRSALSVLVARH